MTPDDLELAEKLLCIWFNMPKITLGDDSVAKRGLAMAQTARTLITAELAAKAMAQHSDDLAVDAFASAMKEKLKFAREQKGRGGWENCPTGDLVDMLYAHLAKGDMRDVANFAMMLCHNLNGRPVLDMPDLATLTAQAEALRRENGQLREAFSELIECADLRGDADLPHPADDPKLWTARMQDAWNEARAALEASDAKEEK